MPTILHPFDLRNAALAVALVARSAFAQAPAPAESVPAPPPARPAPPPADAAAGKASALDRFAWLAGCWRGSVNKREFREHWMPLRGGLMLGTSQTVVDGATQDFDYLRLEIRPDGVYYVTLPQGRNPPLEFRWEPAQSEDGEKIPVFIAPGGGFPSRIEYRRGEEGWLYVNVEGKLKGEDRKVVYPMRHVACEGGENLAK